MRTGESLRNRWSNLSVTTKFGAAFATFLSLIIAVALMNFVSLTLVRRQVQDSIVVSMDIQRLVLQMDATLQHARLLQRDFFLRWPEIGFEKAKQTYVSTNHELIGQVAQLSDQLRKTIANSDVSASLRDRNVDINFYLSAARRYDATFGEAVDLVSQLAGDTTGAQSRLAAVSSALYATLHDADDMLAIALYREMQASEKSYMATRSRPLLQSAINVGNQLNRRVWASPSFNAGQRQQVTDYLQSYGKIAGEVADLDVQIRSLFKEFDLQDQAVNPISTELISLAKAEVVTDRMNFEMRILEEKGRADEASREATEKNRMLESLSSKLSKYLSPQVYSTIFTGEQEVRISSKRKKLTVFFSDIAGFTETTDSLESEELTELLNNYLTEMSKIALEHGATIDKYIGDAILIFFGDPDTRGAREDALACVTMAIAMQRRMRELQAEWLSKGLERPFQLRIGINTGFCTVGNFGSEDRMDYTIVGNEVNLAARLQAQAEVGGILLAHETYSLVRDAVPCAECEPAQVKGFAKAVRNYSVLDIYAQTDARGEVIEREDRGLRLRVELDQLTGEGRLQAIRALQEAIERLRQ